MSGGARRFLIKIVSEESSGSKRPKSRLGLKTHQSISLAIIVQNKSSGLDGSSTHFAQMDVRLALAKSAHQNYKDRRTTTMNGAEVRGDVLREGKASE